MSKISLFVDSGRDERFIILQSSPKFTLLWLFASPSSIPSPLGTNPCYPRSSFILASNFCASAPPGNFHTLFLSSESISFLSLSLSISKLLFVPLSLLSLSQFLILGFSQSCSQQPHWGARPSCYSGKKVLCHKNGWAALHCVLLFRSEFSKLKISWSLINPKNRFHTINLLGLIIYSIYRDWSVIYLFL